MSLRRREFGLGFVAASLPWPGRPAWAAAADPGPSIPHEPPALPEGVRMALEATGLPLQAFGLRVQPVGPGAGRAVAPLVSLHADRPFQMASTVKLVTSLAALDLLGPGYRWHTHACLDGPLRDGRLLGDLVIVGGGDPRLGAEALQAWLAGLRDRGLREVWGDIVLDRSVFDLAETDHALTPVPDPAQPGFVRPEGLMLDAGVLRVGLRGAIASGAPPQVHLRPRQAGLPVVQQLAPGRQCQAAALLEGPAHDPRVVVRGEWAAACGEREIAQLAVPHAELTRAAVAELWRDVGGRLKGRVRGVAAPGDGGAPRPPHARWASLASPALDEVLLGVNKLSDNLAARTLFLSLAEDFPQRPATLPRARARVGQWLHARGLVAGDIALDNGAGLSYAERGRPRAPAQLLRQAWHGPHAKTFIASLPIAGVDGTLWRRMTSGPATGRALLKTGSGIETRSLAGYVRCESGRVQALTAFVNHPQAAAAVPAIDAVVEWVVLNG